MPHDVDLLRDILLYLEGRQVSPRATVMVEVAAEAAELGLDERAFGTGLNLLLDLDYIEGPGAEAGGIWLFRKLTGKGVQFVRAARRPADWDRIKQRHGGGQVPIR